MANRKIEAATKKPAAKAAVPDKPAEKKDKVAPKVAPKAAPKKKEES